MVTGSDFHTNEAAIERVRDRLIAEGRYVEAGWQSLRMISVPPDATELQLRTMRACFFAGAHHLLGGVDLWAWRSSQGEMAAGHAFLGALRTELEEYGKSVVKDAEAERNTIDKAEAKRGRS